MGFYIRGAATAPQTTGALSNHERMGAGHERMPPTPKGRGRGSASGRERLATCLRVAIVTVTGTDPSLPRGVQVCQLSSRQPIILPSTGMRVCLTFARCNQFGSVPGGKVAHLGSHPNGLTGCEVGCLIVDCHEVGSFGSG